MYYIYDKDVKYTYISVSKDFNEDQYLRLIPYNFQSLSVVPRPKPAASPGSVVEMRSGPYLRLTASETLRLGPGTLCFNKPCRRF